MEFNLDHAIVIIIAKKLTIATITGNDSRCIGKWQSKITLQVDKNSYLLTFYYR